MMTMQLDAWENRLLVQAYAPLESRLRHDVQHLADRAQSELAYHHCQTITREHSHTFFVASAMLPRAQRKAIRALYAFCRVSDDLVDRAGGDKAGRLAEWRQRSLHSQPQASDPVALAWADARARYQIPRQYAEQLLDGIASDLSRSRYQTFADLAEYSYAVASTVGLMSMHIVGYSGKEAIPYAVKLGVALQLTNILRDVGEDWANGRLYLPQDELARFGLTEEDVERGVVDDRWRAFMRFQIARARQLYVEALPGVMLLHRKGRLAIAAAAELYQAILDDIEANDYDVFNRRAHTTTRRKLALLPAIWWRARFGSYAVETGDN
jgi:phytoene synthase